MLDKKRVKEIVKYCQQKGILYNEELDTEILEYSAEHDRTAENFDRGLMKFRKAAGSLPEYLINLLRGQYIAFQVFKNKGLLRKYLRRSEFRNRSSEELTYLERQLHNPMRFAFCQILERVGDHLFVMVDCFSDEEFLVYSPGMTITLKEENESILNWLLMIHFNGKCYQTYGPLINFNNLMADDFFFFACEKNPAIHSDKGVIADLNRDPLPYMLLVVGSRIPQTVNQGHIILNFFAAIDLPLLDLGKLEKDFSIQQKGGIYRLGLKNYDIFPHFARAYYDSRNQELQLHAFTPMGFEAIAEVFIKHKYTTAIEPDLVVSPILPSIIKQILGKEVNLDKYEHLFEEKQKVSPGEKEELDKINRFMSLLMQEINEKKKPDLEKLAGGAGISIDTALDIYSIVKGKMGEFE